MSGFWSGWIIVLAILTIGISLFLFVWGLWIRIPTQPDGTTGHNWDGIREGLHNLPRWWIVVSAISFIVPIVYLVLYPGLGDFKGVLGWTSEGELEQDIAANDAKFDKRLLEWQGLTVELMAKDPDAVQIGHRLYLDNCAGCHGNEALGNATLGAPDLTDNIWDFGGDGTAILASILDGRTRMMPGWRAALGDDGVEEVTSYVQSLSGPASRGWEVRAGKARFDMLCSACHGPGGVGVAGIGPSLADDAWLYGSHLADIRKSIRDGRTGVMPAWRARLDEDQARLITAWVLSRGPRERQTDG